jgi:dipeptide/tripeptide permease
MMSAKLAGALILGVPLVAVAWLALRRQPRAVFVFALALLAVALGYLALTGATDDIASKLLQGPIFQPAG